MTNAPAVQPRRLVGALQLLTRQNARLVARKNDEARDIEIGGVRVMVVPQKLVRELVARGFLDATGERPSYAGRDWLRRALYSDETLRAQHGAFERRAIESDDGTSAVVTVDLSESPLGWLRRRRDVTGKPLIDDVRFAAGERLRADVTRAQMLPRTTANWEAPVAGGRRADGMESFSHGTLAARERVRHALSVVGPELSGVLMDVCCFLHGLEQVERDRGWPPRSARIVLGLGLDRLAAHYGLSAAATGPERSVMRGWRSAPAQAAD